MGKILRNQFTVNSPVCSASGAEVKNCRCEYHRAARNKARKPISNDDLDDDDDDDEADNSGATINRRIRPVGGAPLVPPASLVFNYTSGPAATPPVDDRYGG